MLNKYFDATFCINLARRPDRKKQAQAEFEKYGIEVEFINGIDGRELNLPATLISSDGLPIKRGDMGCARSHQKIALLAKEKQLKSYLVFEDDVVFHENFNELFDSWIKQVPSDYDWLYFGGNHMGGYTNISENVMRVFRTYTTHAFAVKENVYDSLIYAWDKYEKVDISASSLHPKFNTYCFAPSLAWQRPGYSDILDMPVDYKHLYQ